MKKISVFDTTVSDENIGNQIIMESVQKYLGEIFPHDFFFKLPYMEITKHTIAFIKRSDLVFFGGTNSLNGRMESYRQWDINLTKSFRINNVILMGIGWWQYENRTSLYTKFVLRNVLSKSYTHSVRDSHTKEKLSAIGFNNTLNTGCPTLWELTSAHCLTIPTKKSENVIFTLTDYNQNQKRDRQILKALSNSYNKMYFWIQGEGDLKYINEIRTNENIILIDPKLSAFDEALQTLNADYVGTRLHAGIRALQKGRRTIIIGIDNRALEMHADFNLPVINQSEVHTLTSYVNSNFECKINLPEENIRQWKEQFIK